MSAPPEPMAYTVHEAALLVRVSERTIRRAISSGKLRAVHIGRAVRVPRDSLASLLSTVSPCAEDKRDIAATDSGEK
jgi:excisionase family DNA binding protein